MKAHSPKFPMWKLIILMINIITIQNETHGQESLILSYEREMDLAHPFPAILTDQDFALVATEESFDRFTTLQNNSIEIWSTLTYDSPDYHDINFLYEHESGFYYTGEGGLSTHSSFGRLNKISGNIEVQQTYDDPNSGIGQSLAITDTYGNNFMVGGYTYSTLTGSVGILRVVNQLGELLSTKTSNDNGGLWGDIIYQVMKTKDNGYLLAGSIAENNNCGEISNKSLWLCKLNPSLNVIWSRKYGNGNGSVSKAYGSDYYGPKCIILNTNEIVVLGSTFCTDGNGGGPDNIGEGKFLMKLDATGNIETLNLIDISFPDYVKSFTDIEIGCGDYFVLAGVQGGFIGTSYFVEKYDYDLMPVEVMLTVADQDKTTRFVAIDKGQSGAYLLSGEKFYYDNDGNYLTDEFIAKTSADPGCAHCDNIPFDIATYGDCENFEGLSLGDISPQGNPRFTLFDNDPGFQAYVTENAPGNNGQALLFDNFSDIDYNIGRTIESPTRLEWNIYFPAGKTGSWGLETQSPTSYALVAAYDNGTATVISNGTIQTTFSYPQNTWLKTVIVFSPANNTIELWSAGEIIFTLTNFTSDKVTDLNFYFTDTSSNNLFYIDDVLYYETSSDCNDILSGDPVCVDNVSYDFESQALCNGYSVSEWTPGQCCVGLGISQNVTQTSCGLNNGAITILPEGGSGYTYLWSNGSSTQTISSLASGTYTVTVTSSDGCTTSSSTSINSSVGLTVIPMGVDESCNDCNDGQATVTPSGGSGYLFQWSNGGTSQTITDLGPGTYTVTVTASNGCNATSTVTINEFGCPPITILIEKTDPDCFGSCEGIAVANPNGGSFPYTYQWSNGATSQIVTNMCPGNYFITIVDATGCSQTQSITIENGIQVIGSIDQTGDSLTANGSGGTSPYSYQWNTGATTQLITPSTSGIYTATITDANDCSTIVTFEFLHTAIVDIQTIQGKVYPNPVQIMLNIDVPLPDGQYTLSIYDLNGSEISNSTTMIYQGSSSHDMADLPAGFYILKLSGIESIIIARFIKS